MINAQLDLYILSLCPNTINVLVNPDNKVLSSEITSNDSINYQLLKLLQSNTIDIPEIYANFRFVDLDIIDTKLVISYLILFSQTQKVNQTFKYISIENLLNANTHRIIQKIKNII